MWKRRFRLAISTADGSSFLVTAVGVEMHGDPFLGVHWNIREDFYHQLGLKPEALHNGDVVSFGSVKVAFHLLGTSTLPDPWSQS